MSTEAADRHEARITAQGFGQVQVEMRKFSQRGPTIAASGSQSVFRLEPVDLRVDHQSPPVPGIWTRWYILRYIVGVS